MSEEEFYGEKLAMLYGIKDEVMQKITNYLETLSQEDNPLEYCISRIKDPISMQNKLKKRNLPPTCDYALTHITDTIGIRVICSFIDHVYELVDWIKQQSQWHVIKEKDYILKPKMNGYRSYHIILSIQKEEQFFVEIQMRTIAMDFWASLEHQMKYKKNIAHCHLIENELKRCADEIASLDLSMQTIKDLIHT